MSDGVVGDRGELAGRLSRWLKAAGVDDADACATLAVGLDDSLTAMKVVEHEVMAMLESDPRTAEGADAALEHAAMVSTYLFFELKGHVDEMKDLWEPVLEETLARRIPDDDKPDEAEER